MLEQYGGAMLIEEAKQAIDSLSYEEMLQEVIKDKTSRFQGEKYEYLLTRYILLGKQKEDAQKLRELELGKEANEIAKAANETASKAYRMSTFSVVVAVVALLVAVVQYLVNKP
jgi:hypothetical protein